MYCVILDKADKLKILLDIIKVRIQMQFLLNLSGFGYNCDLLNCYR